MSHFKTLAYLCAAVLSSTGHAASFDCTKSFRQSEKIICADSLLSLRDDIMAKKFEYALSLIPDKSQVRRSQIAWRIERDKCRTTECLQSSYREREEALANAIAKSNAAKEEISARSKTDWRERARLYQSLEASLDTKLININREVYSALKDSGAKLKSTAPTIRKIEEMRRKAGFIHGLNPVYSDKGNFVIYSKISAFSVDGFEFFDPAGDISSRETREAGHFTSGCKYRIEVHFEALEYDCQSFSDGSLDDQVKTDLLDVLEKLRLN